MAVFLEGDLTNRCKPGFKNYRLNGVNYKIGDYVTISGIFLPLPAVSNGRRLRMGLLTDTYGFSFFFFFFFLF
jgi:hypothetical protein